MGACVLPGGQALDNVYSACTEAIRRRIGLLIIRVIHTVESNDVPITSWASDFPPPDTRCRYYDAVQIGEAVSMVRCLAHPVIVTVNFPTAKMPGKFAVPDPIKGKVEMGVIVRIGEILKNFNEPFGLLVGDEIMAAHAGKSVERLAEKLGATMFTFCNSKTAVDENHPRFVKTLTDGDTITMPLLLLGARPNYESLVNVSDVPHLGETNVSCESVLNWEPTLTYYVGTLANNGSQPAKKLAVITDELAINTLEDTHMAVKILLQHLSEETIVVKDALIRFDATIYNHTRFCKDQLVFSQTNQPGNACAMALGVATAHPTRPLLVFTNQFDLPAIKVMVEKSVNVCIICDGKCPNRIWDIDVIEVFQTYQLKYIVQQPGPKFVKFRV